MNILSSLGINLPTFIAQVVNFGILFAALYFVAYRPILRKLDERAQRIKDSLEAGERVKQEAVSAEKEVAKKIEEASLQGQQIVDQAVKAAEDVKRRAEGDARKQAEVILEKARAETAREKEEAMAELRKEVADLAVSVAGKAIGRSLDKQTQQALINDALKEAASLGK